MIHQFIYLFIFFTGSEVGNQIVSVLLSTNMFVGGFIGFVLDNLLPGKKLL